MVRPYLLTAGPRRASLACLPPPVQLFFRLDGERNPFQRLLRLGTEDVALLPLRTQQRGTTERRRTVALPVRFHAILTEAYLVAPAQLLCQLSSDHLPRTVEDRNRHTPRSAPERRPEVPALLRAFPCRDQSFGRPLPQRCQPGQVCQRFLRRPLPTLENGKLAVHSRSDQPVQQETV